MVYHSYFINVYLSLSEDLGKIPMSYIADGECVYTDHSYLFSWLLTADKILDK